MRRGGYAGRILRVDLSSEQVRVESWPERWVTEYIGGDGFAAHILYKEVPAGTDPLSPTNRLILATGPVTGTMWPTSGRSVFVSKAPLTGIWGESHVGGFLGAELKYAGYDLLVIEGSAERPVYLMINDDDIDLVDASSIWGLSTADATSAILRASGDPDAQVAAIGPAGERRIRYASIMVNRARAAGRTGMGAVMGSKNLKAIAVRGHGSVEVADLDEFLRLAREAHRRVREDPQAQQMSRWGTWVLTAVKQEIGELPTFNHRTGVFDGWERLSAEHIRSHYTVNDRACFGCPVGCKKVNYVREGPFAGTFEEGPEYEGLMAFGSLLGIGDYATALRANQLCNRYGMDVISAGATIAFAIESFEQGLLTKEDTDGLTLRWGDSKLVIRLLQMIANREGIGDILADGSREASRRLGRGTDRFAIHVKGLEVSGQDGRTHRSIGLSHATGARGADHLRSLVTVDQLGYEKVAAERWGADRLLEIIDPYTERYKAVAVVETENTYCIRDTLIVCWYTVSWPPIFWMRDFAQLLPAVTGEESLGSTDQLIEIAERQVTLKRMFNVREGITREDDQLPDRFTKEPMPEGPGKGQVVHLNPMLDDYYRLRGWDVETGIPTRETLDRLSLGWMQDGEEGAEWGGRHR